MRTMMPVYSLGLAALIMLVILGMDGPAFAQDQGSVATETAVDNDTDQAIGGSVLSGSVRPNGSPGNNKSDQDSARDETRRGRMMSYGEVLKRVSRLAPGDVVRVRLTERQGGLWIYEVTVLDATGRYIKLSLNARTSALISRRSQ